MLLIFYFCQLVQQKILFLGPNKNRTEIEIDTFFSGANNSCLIALQLPSAGTIYNLFHVTLIMNANFSEFSQSSHHPKCIVKTLSHKPPFWERLSLCINEHSKEDDFQLHVPRIPSPAPTATNRL